MTQERYNSAILASLNKRAELQLRLQHAVEGFSIVAISYYLLGVLGYGLKALGKLGVPVEAELATGLALPLVVGAVWFAVRRAQRALHRGHPPEDPAPAPGVSSS